MSARNPRQGRSMGEPTYEPRPGSVPHPGATLSEWLRENKHTQLWLANQIGWEAHQVSRLVNGHSGYSVETALRLAKITGLSAQFWMHLQADYLINQALQDWAEDVDPRPGDRHTDP